MNISKIILSLTCLLFFLETYAQSAPPGTPIDGGLSLLLAAGGAYGTKRLLGKKKES